MQRSLPGRPRQEANLSLGQKPVWPLSTESGNWEHILSNVRYLLNLIVKVYS